MNLKRLFLNEKFYTPNTIVQFRWINESTNIKILKHSWDKEIVKQVLHQLVEHEKIMISDLRTENYYQDREKNWWISNEGKTGGYQVLDTLSYVVNNQRPVMTINIQKRDKLLHVNVPNIPNLHKYYSSKRHHLTLDISEQISLHVTIPIDNENGYQVWMEMPIVLTDAEYDLVTYWSTHMYELLQKSFST